MRGEDTSARMYASLCLNGHPAIQAKYTYSTLLLALLFGCVVYAPATSLSFYTVPGMFYSLYANQRAQFFFYGKNRQYKNLIFINNSIGVVALTGWAAFDRQFSTFAF